MQNRSLLQKIFTSIDLYFIALDTPQTTILFLNFTVLEIYNHLFGKPHIS